MTKRERIKQKYNGRCAYSGTLLEDDWQIDHFNPIIRGMFGLKPLFPDETDSNLVPCQKAINHYKGAYDSEGLRALLLTLHKRIKHTPRTPQRIKAKEYLLNVANYFGITPDTPWHGQFYFEIFNKEEK